MLPETGAITMKQVNTELKKSETAKVSLNDADVRKLAKKEKGTISMNDLRGKKASEYVESYQVYSNSWNAYKEDFNFSFPHKIVSGKIIVTASQNTGTPHGHRGSVTILGKILSVSGTVTMEVDIPAGTTELPVMVYVGSDGQTHSDSYTTLHLTIKFTGEWEV